jgi:acetyl esterase/lipase
MVIPSNARVGKPPDHQFNGRTPQLNEAHVMMTSALSARGGRLTDPDCDVAALLAALGSQIIPPASEQTPEQLRANFAASVAELDGPAFVPEPVASAGDLRVKGIRVRAYRPEADPAAVFAFFHGGGFVAGNVDAHEKITRRLCVGTSSVVASVDYRLAPVASLAGPR